MSSKSVWKSSKSVSKPLRGLEHSQRDLETKTNLETNMFLKLRQNNKFSKSCQIWNNKNVFWTKHSKRKMQYYNLSEKRVLRILRKPDRIEEGIAPQTIAKMQITGTLKHQTEIWMMYQTLKMRNSGQELKIKIISAWRYPGRTLIGERPIIPEDTLRSVRFNPSSGGKD